MRIISYTKHSRTKTETVRIVDRFMRTLSCFTCRTTELRLCFITEYTVCCLDMWYSSFALHAVSVLISAKVKLVTFTLTHSFPNVWPIVYICMACFRNINSCRYLCPTRTLRSKNRITKLRLQHYKVDLHLYCTYQTGNAGNFKQLLIRYSVLRRSLCILYSFNITYHATIEIGLNIK